MGGWGSGRGQSGKDTTSDYRALDVRRLQRDGLLTPGRSFGWNWTRDGETVASIQIRAETDRVILNYRHKSGGSDWQPMDYPVRLAWTDCTLGGRRAWLICPAARMWATCCDSLRRYYLRLSALLPPGLFQPAGKSG